MIVQSVEEWLQRSQSFLEASKSTEGAESILLLHHALEMSTKAYIPLLDSDIGPKKDISHQLLELERLQAKTERDSMIEKRDQVKNSDIPGSKLLDESAEIFQQSKESIETLSFDTFEEHPPDYEELRKELSEDDLVEVSREELKEAISRLGEGEAKLEDKANKFLFSEEAMAHFDSLIAMVRDRHGNELQIDEEVLSQLTDLIYFIQVFGKLYTIVLKVKKAFHDFDRFDEPLHIRLRYHTLASVEEDNQIQIIKQNAEEIRHIMSFHNGFLKGLNEATEDSDVPLSDMVELDQADKQ